MGVQVMSGTYFQHLLKRDHSHLISDDDESEETDYPGSTPPRTREDSPRPKTIIDEVLTAARSTNYKVGG